MRAVDHANGLRTWHFGFDGDGVLAAVTTRRGGRSEGPYAGCNLGLHVGDDDGDVLANRTLVCEALGVDRLTVADQQHGRTVRRIDRSMAGAGHSSLADARARLGATDALVTDVPGVALGVLVADCAPVVLVDADRRALGVAHVGRRGADLDVLGAVVAEMHEGLGADPSTLLAGIGPCIGAASYEIGEREAAASAAALGDDLLRPSRPGHACFDLLGAVRRRLAQAGVAAANVEVAGVDTYEAEADLYSDRRARPCGRFMLVASLTGRR
jgi:YfiH family protein